MKNDNDVTICWHDFIVNFFWHCFVSLSKFSYWSKFHVNIIIGFGVITILFIRDWSKIRESEIPLSEFCPISGYYGKSGHKFGANVSNKMLLNAVKCQGYRFYCFWVIKGKSTGGGNTFPPPRLGLKECNLTNVSVHFFFFAKFPELT